MGTLRTGRLWFALFWSLMVGLGALVRGATVTGTFRNSDGTAYTSAVTFRPVSSPSISGSDTITGADIKVTPNGSGSVSTSLTAGYYSVYLGSTRRFTIAVPSGSDTVDVTSILSTPAWLVPGEAGISGVITNTYAIATASVRGLVKTDSTSSDPVVDLSSTVTTKVNASSNAIIAAKADRVYGLQFVSAESDLYSTDPTNGYVARVFTGTTATDWNWNSAEGGPDVSGERIRPTNYVTGSWIAGTSWATSKSASSSKAAVFNSSGQLQSSSATATELGYLSGATNSVQTEINKRSVRPTGLTTLYTLGDSIAYGSSADTYSLGWAAKLAAANGWAEQRLAYGSGRIIDYYWQSQPPFRYTNSGNVAVAPSSIAESQVWAVGMGDYNGMRDYGTSAAYQAHSRSGFQALLVALATPTKIAASAATSSGTWSTMTNLGGIRTSTSASATLTFTNVVGDVAYIAYIASTSNDFGAVTIAVNGTNYGSFAATGAYGNRELDNGTDSYIPDYIAPNGNGKLWYMPYVARIPLGYSSRHTVVVTASGATGSTPSGVLWVAGNGQRRAAQNVGPLVMVSGTPRQATWTGSGSELAAGQFSALIQQTVSTLQSDGLAVYYVPTEQWFDEYSQMSGDGVHPSNSGHTAIAAAFQDTVDRLRGPASSQGQAAKLPSGVAIGSAAALTGDLRFPQGTAMVWRNSAAFDGAYLTNSGTGLQISAPNSSGSIWRSYLWRGDAYPMKSEDYATFAAGSPVGASQSVTFGLASGTAVLNQTVVTEAQSGTGGFAIHDTSLTRSSSGSGESSIYRAQVGGRNVFRVLASGRLLIDSADGNATSARFGAGGDSSTGIYFGYSGSGNTELQVLSSGEITATSNDGLYTAKRLALNTGGGDVTLGTLASASGSGVYVTQSAIDRRMVLGSGSSIDVLLNGTGATGQTLTLNPSGGAIFLGAGGTTNQAMSWSGGSGTDRRLQFSGNTIQVSLNSSSTSYQNLAVQTSGGTMIVGPGTAGAGLRVSSTGTIMSRVKFGTAVLVGGTVTVSDSTVTASTVIDLTGNVDGGTPGWHRVSARSIGSSFTITSSSGTDTSTVGYVMYEP
jgi:hypothetical protein